MDWTGGRIHTLGLSPQYLFGDYPLYCDEVAILIDYVVKKMGKKRVVFLYQNHDFGKEGLYGAEVVLEKYGIKLVAAASVELMDTDFIELQIHFPETYNLMDAIVL